MRANGFSTIKLGSTCTLPEHCAVVIQHNTELHSQGVKLKQSDGEHILVALQKVQQS